ncbi:hypothetical protein E2562_029148 [Oryza meyeriana var. granulata]|uniref:Uncharacterized protein n=1 Tax=Oryza meyeriana var. granulata TaxID=110450 RepID=A0A6G1E479_9ORYZ|nr:hypothetical protein E2562_029148 [Oryza meyeriana var. granulata]
MSSPSHPTTPLAELEDARSSSQQARGGQIYPSLLSCTAASGGPSSSLAVARLPLPELTPPRRVFLGAGELGGGALGVVAADEELAVLTELHDEADTVGSPQPHVLHVIAASGDVPEAGGILPLACRRRRCRWMPSLTARKRVAVHNADGLNGERRSMERERSS